MLSPRGQSGLQAEILASASASKLWPRPRGFGLGLASISLSYYVIVHFSGKNRVKFGNFVNFSGNNLNHMLLIIIWYFFHNYFWPRPWPHPPDIGLGLGLVALASALASMFWPRLTSLAVSRVAQLPIGVGRQCKSVCAIFSRSLQCDRSIVARKSDCSIVQRNRHIAQISWPRITAALNRITALFVLDSGCVCWIKLNTQLSSPR